MSGKTFTQIKIMKYENKTQKNVYSILNSIFYFLVLVFAFSWLTQLLLDWLSYCSSFLLIYSDFHSLKTDHPKSLASVRYLINFLMLVSCTYANSFWSNSSFYTHSAQLLQLATRNKSHNLSLSAKIYATNFDVKSF